MTEYIDFVDVPDVWGEPQYAEIDETAAFEFDRIEFEHPVVEMRPVFPGDAHDRSDIAVTPPIGNILMSFADDEFEGMMGAGVGARRLE